MVEEINLHLLVSTGDNAYCSEECGDIQGGSLVGISSGVADEDRFVEASDTIHLAFRMIARVRPGII